MFKDAFGTNTTVVPELFCQNQEKIIGTKNKARDYENKESLLKAGWRVLWVWECSMKTKEAREKLPLKIAAWLEGSDQFGEIPELNYSSTDQSQEA